MQFCALPAIDLMDGKCVRLLQGDFAKQRSFGNQPIAQALLFAEAGALRLHIIDLDGARAGQPCNGETIAAICGALASAHPDVTLQVGGGLRDMAAIETTLAHGVYQVILGTAAIVKPHFLQQACATFPDRVLLSLDARNGKLAVGGWVKDTDIDVIEFAKSAADTGIAGIVVTDIARDGMAAGPNLELTQALALQVNVPIYAAGGVRSVADIAALRKLALAGAIVGTAMYDGQTSIGELINA